MGNSRSGRADAAMAGLGLLGLGVLLTLAACGSSPSTGKTESDGGVREDAGSSDAGACACKATWEVDNLIACWQEPGAATPIEAYSSYYVGDASVPSCDPGSTTFPHPTPNQPWSTNRLTGTCTGTATFCLTIKQGSAAAPKDTDCVLATLCGAKPVHYEEANKTMELPPIPAWSADDEKCATDFYDKGGYFEMIAKDYALGDCKSGKEILLGRVPFCPVHCSIDPNKPECAKCGDGSAKIEF